MIKANQPTNKQTNKQTQHIHPNIHIDTYKFVVVVFTFIQH